MSRVLSVVVNVVVYDDEYPVVYGTVQDMSCCLLLGIEDCEEGRDGDDDFQLQV